MSWNAVDSSLTTKVDSSLKHLGVWRVKVQLRRSVVVQSWRLLFLSGRKEYHLLVVSLAVVPYEMIDRNE